MGLLVDSSFDNKATASSGVVPVVSSAGAGFVPSSGAGAGVVPSSGAETSPSGCSA